MSAQPLAKEVATLLDRDPVMAASIKNHISPDRLREILELPPPDTDKDLEAALALVVEHYTLEYVLSEYNAR